MNNKEFQELVLQELTGIKDKVGGIKDKVAGIETVQKGMQNRLDRMEIRQDEIYQVVKAIEHSNQVGRSEMDSQNIRLAGVEGKLKKVAGVLNENVDAAG